MNKIQSFSNIITNSSSEVFILDTDKHQEVEQLLTDVCEVLGLNIEDVMGFESADCDGVADRYDLNSIYKKGNLLIWSAEDNSIPFYLMDLIDCLNWERGVPKSKDLNIKSVKRIHLG